MDRVEERREAVDVVELARERGGEVETETVDVAVDHEVAQRVHDQTEHARVHRVEAVSRPGEIHVVAPVVRHQPVVRGVVDALEAEHRPQVVALGRVVVDDVEDHLDARPMQRLDHPLELPDLLAPRAGRRVQRVRSEEADRAVAPVVRQAPLDEMVLVGDVVDRQQLDRRHPERSQVRDRPVRGEPGIGAAQILAHIRVALREPLHVRLVDHRLVPRRAEQPVALPVERRIDDHALRDRGGVVLVVGLEVGVVAAGHVRQRRRGLPADRPLDRLRVRVDQELARVEAVPFLGSPPPVDPVGVALSGPDAGQVAVPVEGGALGHRHARLVVGVVVEAEVDTPGVLGEQREVRPLAVPDRPERERMTRPDVHARSSTVRASKSAISVASPRRIVSVRPCASACTSRGRVRRSESSLR